MSIGYHSVYLPEEPAEPRGWWTGGGNSAFVWNAANAGRLPAAFNSCDILYADLPWRKGYADYLSRADVRYGSWARLMQRTAGRIAAWTKPAVLVTGAHARRYLPPAAQELPVRMPVAGRQAAVAYVYGAAFSVDWDGTDELVAYLAARFGRVGDFCAGYGWAPRAFVRAGGSFVASDVNPKCVGYIAEHAKEWGAP